MAEVASHIRVDENGVAWIEDTRFKVRVFAEVHFGLGWDADELHRQYPDLSLAQIYAALAYIYDHREQIEREIAQSEERMAALMKSFQEPPLQKRLRELSRGQ